MFSIHSHLAGRDVHGVGAIVFQHRLFNPLAPCGARQPVDLLLNFHYAFQSTRPLRGETKQVAQSTYKLANFQSTRPLRGETCLRNLDGKSTCCFSIHSPLAGRDTLCTLTMQIYQTFQSTRPLRGETIFADDGGFPQYLFNPLAPCGARPSASALSKSDVNFQSTRPLRGETLLMVKSY